MSKPKEKTARSIARDLYRQSNIRQALLRGDRVALQQLCFDVTEPYAPQTLGVIASEYIETGRIRRAHGDLRLDDRVTGRVLLRFIVASAIVDELLALHRERTAHEAPRLELLYRPRRRGTIRIQLPAFSCLVDGPPRGTVQ